MFLVARLFCRVASERFYLYVCDPLQLKPKTAFFLFDANKNRLPQGSGLRTWTVNWFRLSSCFPRGEPYFVFIHVSTTSLDPADRCNLDFYCKTRRNVECLERSTESRHRALTPLLIRGESLRKKPRNVLKPREAGLVWFICVFYYNYSNVDIPAAQRSSPSSKQTIRLLKLNLSDETSCSI